MAANCIYFLDNATDRCVCCILLYTVTNNYTLLHSYTGA